MYECLDHNHTLIQIIESWAMIDSPLNSTKEILAWVKEKNEEIHVEIKKIPLQQGEFWFYDKKWGEIRNKNNSFFKIKGLQCKSAVDEVEQPIILQNEIGYLGIIGKVIDGILYFLMQAKIEPGNINKIQISPTIQATKSNFMQAHGGKVPAYLEYFCNKDDYEIVVDQIQSEQSSRFLGKRNRNIIIIIQDEIDILDTHRWMTLGQIKELMKYDNLVNMDTRTVIACIPFALRGYSYRELARIRSLFDKESFFNSIFGGNSGGDISRIFHYINEIKMLDKSEILLKDIFGLKDWAMVNNEYVNVKGRGEFKVVFCDIEIEGREVRRWEQPLLEAVGTSVFGLIFCELNGVMKFLIQIVSEVGCFDRVEIGPSIQLGPKVLKGKENKVKDLFMRHLKNGSGVVFSGLFSEEGGRFYHEQNRNVIIEIDYNELDALPEGYFWVDFQTLNILVQFNNCLNIQLRNLLSLFN